MAAAPGQTRRWALALVAAAALAGCGFTPVYGPKGAGSRLDGRVAIEAPQTSDGFVLRQRLQEHFGPLGVQSYRLVVTVETSEQRTAITREQDTRRVTVTGSATYELVTLDGDRLARGQTDSFASYSATGTPLATLSAQRDAYRRLMLILADDIHDRLLVTVPAAGVPR